MIVVIDTFNKRIVGLEESDTKFSSTDEANGWISSQSHPGNMYAIDTVKLCEILTGIFRPSFGFEGISLHDA